MPTIHLGYFFGEQYWGQGYATEIINGLVSDLGNKGESRLLAGVDADNIASARVLEKVGFKKLHERTTVSRSFFELVIS